MDIVQRFFQVRNFSLKSDPTIMGSTQTQLRKKYSKFRLFSTLIETSKT